MEIDLRKFYVENELSGGLNKNHRILKHICNSLFLIILKIH